MGARDPLGPTTQDGTFWFQKLVGERDALQTELEELKRKFEGVRSRNKVLSGDVKTLRSQMAMLTEKGRHDDELIDALMVQPSCSGPATAMARAPQEWAPRQTQKPETRP